MTVAASSNAGLWQHLKIGPSPIPKRHHRPVMNDADAAVAETQCGLSLKDQGATTAPARHM